MDQIKIGKFISLKRKEKNITQCELAEMLGISDRAISNGKTEYVCQMFLIFPIYVIF